MHTQTNKKYDYSIISIIIFQKCIHYALKNNNNPKENNHYVKETNHNFKETTIYARKTNHNIKERIERYPYLFPVESNQKNNPVIQVNHCPVVYQKKEKGVI